MTATGTVVSFPAGDKVQAKAKLESLGVASISLISWQENNVVYVAKVEIT